MIIATFIFTVLLIPYLFSQFPPLNIQRGCETPLLKQNTEQVSAVGSFLRLFLCPEKGAKIHVAKNYSKVASKKTHLQDMSFVTVLPVSQPVKTELTEEEQAENEKSVLDDLEMFG